MERKLRRSRRNRVLFGVLGGLAEYLNVDPTLLRLLFIVIFVFYPVQASLAYILAAIIIPEEGDERDIGERIDGLASELEERFGDVRKSEGSEVLGLLLVLLGLLILWKALVPMHIPCQTVLAVILIVIGVLLLRGD